MAGVTLAPGQRAALRHFALQNGRYWKHHLKTIWVRGTEHEHVDGGILRQIRNDFGPEWLKNFRF